MKRQCQLFQGQQGSSLPMALIALAVGTLLVCPLLMHVSTGQKTTEEMERTLRTQYASDAGVEYALWKLVNDDAWREGLIQGTPEALTMPDSVLVNRFRPAVEAVLVSAEGGGGGGGALLEWVIWAQSETRTNPVRLLGRGHTVNGGVHSNHTIRATGSGHNFNGTVEYVTSISVPGSTTFDPGAPDNPTQGQVGEWPISWDIADFQPGGTYAVAAGAHYFQHDSWSVSGAGITIPEGLHYCTGNVTISSSGLTGHVTIVADGGKINISASELDLTPYVDGLIAFSTKPTTLDAINISGSGNMMGACFAPNGRIRISASGAHVTSALIGDCVAIDGSRVVLDRAVIELPQGGGGGTGCEVYDIQSTAGETVTTVRVRRCEEGGLEVLSWYVD